MSLSRNNSKAVTALLVAASGVGLLYAALWLFRDARAQAGPASRAFYFDLSAGKLFEGPIGAVVPIKAPSDADGPGAPRSGVRAYVFSCSSCDDADSRFVGWLETNSAQAVDAIHVKFGDAKAVAPELAAEVAESVAGGLLVRSTAQSTWMPARSAAARGLIESARSHCGGSTTFESCSPEH